MRAVIDTNVLLDLWVFNDPAVVPLRHALQQRWIEPLWNAACDAELREVLGRPRFGLESAAQLHLRAAWSALVTVVDRVLPAPWTCTDPKDQKFLDLAAIGRASLLLTRDRALLKLDRRTRATALRIITPAATSYARQKPQPGPIQSPAAA